MKSCSVCHQSDVEFGVNKTKQDGLQTICKGCKKSTNAKYFQDTKSKARIRKKGYKKQARQWVFDYLKSHSCIDCGESDPIVLEFDHRSNKKMNIATMVATAYSIATIQKEVAKCDVRCANCHRRKTAKDFGWYKDLKMFYRIVSDISEQYNGPWIQLNDAVLEQQIETHLGSTGTKDFVRLFPRSGNLCDVQNPQPGNNIKVMGANILAISPNEEWAIDFKKQLSTDEPDYFRVTVRI